MFAVTGITGQVGGAVAQNLLQQGHKVRALVRDLDKGRQWEAKGCELIVGDFNDSAAMARAFSNVEGAFIMLPANFAPSPDFRETRVILAAMKQALATARPPKIVCLSSVGAQRSSGLGLITQLHLLENELQNSAPAVAFLRPAWFMENSVWDIAPAKTSGQIPAFLFPLDKPIPMVATADIGRIAVEILAEDWVGRRIVEIEGPQRYSPNDLAASLSVALGRPVSAVAVPRAQWETLFRSQGTPNPQPRIEMLDGLNSDWITFEGTPAEHCIGRINLQSVIQSLVAKS
jgi:uncharacterized protein YbjT (DUF2867 family)